LKTHFSPMLISTYLFVFVLVLSLMISRSTSHTIGLPNWDTSHMPVLLKLSPHRPSYQITYRTTDQSFATITVDHRRLKGQYTFTSTDEEMQSYQLSHWDGVSTPQISLAPGYLFVHLRIEYQTVSGEYSGQDVWINDLESATFKP